MQRQKSILVANPQLRWIARSVQRLTNSIPTPLPNVVPMSYEPTDVDPETAYLTGPTVHTHHHTLQKSFPLKMSFSNSRPKSYWCLLLDSRHLPILASISSGLEGIIRSLFSPPTTILSGAKSFTNTHSPYEYISTASGDILPDLLFTPLIIATVVRQSNGGNPCWSRWYWES